MLKISRSDHLHAFGTLPLHNPIAWKVNIDAEREVEASEEGRIHGRLCWEEYDAVVSLVWWNFSLRSCQHSWRSIHITNLPEFYHFERDLTLRGNREWPSVSVKAKSWIKVERANKMTGEIDSLIFREWDVAEQHRQSVIRWTQRDKKSSGGCLGDGNWWIFT